MIRMYATLALTLLAACSSDPGTKYDYSKCGEPSAIVVTNEDILDGGGLALTKGVEIDIGLRVTDAEGDLCDPRGLELALDDPAQIEVVAQDEDVVLKATSDAIDLGSEPVTGMHATLGDLHAVWPVVSVVALGGTWNVVITEKTRFPPPGYDFGEVTFTQHGRRMVWEDCILSLVCDRDAVIVGASFTVEAPDYNLSISVPIDPDRNRFAGPWSTSDGKYEGDFTAVRLE